MAQAYIYLIGDESRRYCKIGVSGNVQARIQMLNVPFELVVHATMSVMSMTMARAVETRVQDYFSTEGKHLRGEWFEHVDPRKFRKVVRQTIEELVTSGITPNRKYYPPVPMTQPDPATERRDREILGILKAKDGGLDAAKEARDEDM